MAMVLTREQESVRDFIVQGVQVDSALLSCLRHVSRTRRRLESGKIDSAKYAAEMDDKTYRLMRKLARIAPELATAVKTVNPSDVDMRAAALAAYDETRRLLRRERRSKVRSTNPQPFNILNPYLQR